MEKEESRIISGEFSLKIYKNNSGICLEGMVYHHFCFLSYLTAYYLVGLKNILGQLSNNVLWQNNQIWDYNNVEAHFRASRTLTHDLG